VNASPSPTAPVFAWLVLAHAGPDQLRHLLARLLPPDSPDFAVVHLDAKSPLWRKTRGRFLADLPNVTVVERPAVVRWAHPSQLAATRLLLDEALRRPFTHAHLVSGADWPLVSRSAMVADLAEAIPRDCLIEAEPETQAWRMERISLNVRWLRPDPANPLAVRWEWLLRRLSQRLPPRRARPWGPWHKGSQWWSLPRDACERVAAELARGFARGTFRFTQCADEHAVQTIVAHYFPERLGPPRRHIEWTADWSPRILGSADWARAPASGAWLTRKLSLEADPFFLEEQPIR